MFAIEVNFLTLRYTATAFHNRRLPEWPPHPARLFSAMVAEWAVDEDAAERAALEWLESQPPPAITASEELPRKVVSYFVPVNDIAIIAQSRYSKKLAKLEGLLDDHWSEIEKSEGEATSKVETINSKIEEELKVDDLVAEPTATPKKTELEAAVEILPEYRGNFGGKQERYFPSVTPDEPRVTFTWKTNPESSTLQTLDELCERVTRLGHSSSLVSCRVNDDPPPSNLVPSATGQSLRGVTSGQLKILERKFKEHKGMKPRTLPYVELKYSQVEEPQPDTFVPNTAGEWQVFAFASGSRAVPATQTAVVTSVFRAAIFSHAPDPIPEGLTGHKPDGSPSLDPHVGFYALPYIGSEHSDGRLMGVALNIPSTLDDAAKKALYKAINSWEGGEGPSDVKLNFGKAGSLTMQRLTSNSELVTLRPSIWNGAATRWVTATPIALPTHPGKLSKGKAENRSKAWLRAEAAVAKSCTHVGLPKPVDVTVSFDPFVKGVRPAPAYPAFSQTGADGNPVSRKLLHAAITFSSPVAGPLALGAGRFLGLGLMLPLPNKQRRSANDSAPPKDPKTSEGESS